MDLLSMMNGPEEPLAHLTLQGHQTPQEQGEVFLLVGLVDLQTPPQEQVFLLVGLQRVFSYTPLRRQRLDCQTPAML